MKFQLDTEDALTLAKTVAREFATEIATQIERGMKAKYDNLEIRLIEALQERQAEVDMLKSQVRMLEHVTGHNVAGEHP